MQNFVIDIGNTFCKLSVFNNDKLIEKREILKPTKADFVAFCEQYHDIKLGIYSDVRGEYDLNQWPELKKVHWVKLDYQLKMPFTNQYKTPNTLGSDRLALAATAVYYFPKQPCLVISAGTCITLDFVNENAEYMGGSISPGLQMRLDAMHHFTGKLPQLDLKERLKVLNEIGYDTQTSMYSGAIMGAASEIESMINRYKQKYPDLKIILTGGDYLILDELILSSIFARPNLVLLGMNYILKLNV